MGPSPVSSRDPTTRPRGFRIRRDMLLPLAIVAPSVDPDAPDAPFVVDTAELRTTFERWTHPDAGPASGLCTGSLFVGPAGARLAFVDCPDPLRASVERAFASWVVR